MNNNISTPITFLNNKAQLELAAEKVATTNQLLLDQDKRRAINRDVLSAFRSKKNVNKNIDTNEQSSIFNIKGKSWFLTSGVFIKVENSKIVDHIINEQKILDEWNKKTNEQMKIDVLELKRLESEFSGIKTDYENLKSYNLKPLNTNDKQFLHNSSN